MQNRYLNLKKLYSTVYMPFTSIIYPLMMPSLFKKKKGISVTGGHKSVPNDNLETLSTLRPSAIKRMCCQVPGGGRDITANGPYRFPRRERRSFTSLSLRSFSRKICLGLPVSPSYLPQQCNSMCWCSFTRPLVCVGVG